MIPFLAPGAPFPPAERALSEPNGLVAAGGDLTAATLVKAYARGLFPWFGEGDPILWWSPDPRMVLPSDGFHVSRSLARRLRHVGLRVSMDEAFAAVVEACAAPRRGATGTWLVPEMQAAYIDLHRANLAHSVEVWMEGELAGGIYGVGLGRMFFGESMFSRQTDGSKIALAYLTAQMRRWSMPILDCQTVSTHLVTLGARPVPRREFLPMVARLCRKPGPLVWRLDEDLFPTGSR
jgi:leucyl/phenylalanyl-tRNA--protein transferase